MKPAWAILLLCGAPLWCGAQQIYRWVDSGGVVHFSQTPPAEGNYQNVTSSLPQPTTYAPGTAAGGKAQRPPPRDAGAEHDQQALQAKADNEERCAKARERVTFLSDKTAHRLFVTGDNGQPARMTDEQFQQEMKDAQDAVDKYCNG